MELFSHLMLFRDPQPTHRISSVTQIRTERWKEAAIFVNTVLSILVILRLASGGSMPQVREVLGNPQVSDSLGDFLKVCNSIQLSYTFYLVYCISDLLPRMQFLATIPDCGLQAAKHSDG